MRVSVYITGLCVLSTGAVEGFAPSSCPCYANSLVYPIGGRRQSARTLWWNMAVDEDAADVLARVNALDGGKSVPFNPNMYTLAAGLEASYKSAPSSTSYALRSRTKHSRPWTPPQGYVPRRARDAVADDRRNIRDISASGAGAADKNQTPYQIPASTTSENSIGRPSTPNGANSAFRAKSWTPPEGYMPNRDDDEETASSQPSMSLKERFLLLKVILSKMEDSHQGPYKQV